MIGLSVTLVGLVGTYQVLQRSFRLPGLPRDVSVEDYLDELVADSKVPGLQYLVVDSAGIVFEYAGGWADIGESRAMSPRTTLMTYSMTKTITAVSVLRLAQEGSLDLNDPVTTYVEGLPYGESVTVRHLLTHTSGVPNPIPLRWVHSPSAHGTFDQRSALAMRLEANRELRSAPGAEYAYSNLGYWVLGEVVRSVTGQPFEQYATDRILRPLGTDAAELSFAVFDPESHASGYLEKYSMLNLLKYFLIDRDLVGGYDGHWLRINPHYVDGPSFGGLVGNARGFGRFLQDQLRTRSAILEDRMRAELYSVATTSDGREILMTPGWHVSPVGERRHFYKEGGGGGFHSMMRLYREDGIASVVLTNATAFDVRALLDTVDPRFLGF